MADMNLLKIFLCGDVMTGRGIDQILSHPAAPQIYESCINDARDYVLLAEQANGPIPRYRHGEYVWGDSLSELNLRQPHLKLVNLETSITRDGTPCKNKGIQYRMHPDNIDAISAAGIDVCSLANNHVLDWGIKGLEETLETLNRSDIHHAGAGDTIQQAQAPAIFPIPGSSGRILVFSMGMGSSGIPNDWGASSTRPGVWLIDDLSTKTVRQITERIEQDRRPGDFCIVSIHWGANWVHQIPVQHQIFAHELIDMAKVNLIHGHSSHHPIGIEIYKNTPVLYGCGDLINDYEGIASQYEIERDFTFMYFLEFDVRTWMLKHLDLVPFQRKKFTLNYASNEKCHELLQLIQKKSACFNTHFELNRGIIYWKKHT